MIEKVIIVGAAGRDFHNFNVYFRGNPRYRVVAFTAAQIPNIEGRTYPPELAGELYPDGVPIYPERDMADLIREHRIDLVAFSYSDVSYRHVMHKAAIAMAEGADFILLGATYTMLKSSKPVIAVCAVRTGAGKSQTTRKIASLLKDELGKRVVVVRHPMPYGDLRKQVVQRLSSYEDFESNKCTIEEREEYEPLVERGITVYAGIDYGLILDRAESEADIIIWDGGNNDTPFYFPDLHIVVFDPHRAGHELLYYPGETNMIMADVAVINKVDTAPQAKVEEVAKNIAEGNPAATVVLAESPITADDPERIRGRRVLVIEDGPSITHGGMPFGAATIAARKFGAAAIVPAQQFAVGSIRETFERYPHIGNQLPSMGYSEQQIKDLEATINRADCDLVVFSTPADLSCMLQVNRPTIRVRYEYKDHGPPFLQDIVVKRLEQKGIL
ncbi:MAG: cyclic 2,3-diphosphoglycerate synthase [Deltaproteobacteria bacterium]|jgi:predicted GTPase|nr:cyclic 2,3-diphosphoglycerate synthase [Deltaproteobacteria bacterium]MDA8307799.1 cyclic 2,3-diphosphoglycerate synthase [Deltaproteobacteria bacterium]